MPATPLLLLWLAIAAEQPSPAGDAPEAAPGVPAPVEHPASPGAAAAPGHEPPRPRIIAVRARLRPTLDGRLDEAAWRDASPSDDFTQYVPDQGKPPSERTVVRVVYDEEAIYVGVDCEQKGSPIVSRLTRRDRIIESDAVQVDIGSRADHVSAFSFGVNVAGVLFDLIRFNDTNSSSDWDENWDARTALTDHGWSAEIMIPLRILRFSPDSHDDWDFQVLRRISARQEDDLWAFIPRGVGGWVSHYGRLGGFEHLRAGPRFELRPFVLGRLRHRDAQDDVIAQGWDGRPAIGADAKWHVARDLTLDLAVNPDFGQVEADQVVLNLTTFETFYPEKRPFFLEGIDLFATPFQALYTRRIGRRPEVTLADTERLVDAPEPSTIWGAAKMVGNVGPRLSLGALSAVTGRNDVTIQAMDGSRQGRVAEPLSAFNVLRLKRAMGENADLGLLGTAVNRLEPGFNDAYVGGVDGRWRSRSGEYAVSGQALASRLEKGPERAEPDGLPIRPGHFAPGAQLAVERQARHWIWDVVGTYRSKELELNDAGFLQRKNDVGAGADVGWQTLDPWGPTLETRTQLETNYRSTLDGIQLSNIYQINETVKFRSFWRLFVELHWRRAHFDDRETGDGTALERAGLWGLETHVTTDPRRAVMGDLFVQSQKLSDGWNFAAEGNLTLRTHPQLDLGIAPNAVWTLGEPRFVGSSSATTYLFGRLEARELGATLRATYTFAPRLTLQAYAQVFLASGHYTDFQSADTGGRFRSEIRLRDLVPTIVAPGFQPDFQEVAVNANILLRWEYQLGSTLYLVYTRAQAPSLVLMPGDVPGLDIRRLRGSPATDVLMVKVSYWWG